MTQDFHAIVGTETKPGNRLRSDGEVAPSLAVAEDHAILKSSNGRRSWAEADGTFWAVQQACPVLPCGVYRMDIHPQMGAIFQRQKNDTDTLLPMPDSESEKIMDEIRVFKTLKPAFEKHGFLYKRGILMWGPPGSGKTSTLQQLIKLLVEQHDSIAVLVDRPGTAAFCLQALRTIEPDRQIIAILEDLDALTDKYGESEYLSLLDGESQVNNIVFVATTNYPERLDKRFVDRPSRFDTVRFIGMPGESARRHYLRTKIGDSPMLDEMVQASKDFSIAHLRELIILTQCFGQPVGVALERLRKTIKNKPSSDRNPDGPGVGFMG